jgi:hypothetical protein
MVFHIANWGLAFYIYFGMAWGLPAARRPSRRMEAVMKINILGNYTLRSGC